MEHTWNLQRTGSGQLLQADARGVPVAQDTAAACRAPAHVFYDSWASEGRIHSGQSPPPRRESGRELWQQLFDRDRHLPEQATTTKSVRRIARLPGKYDQDTAHPLSKLG